jgi:hypothetical protein
LIPTDGLDQHKRDIWFPRADEAAPFDQAGVHRVDYEGSIIEYANVQGYLHHSTVCVVEQFLLYCIERPLFWLAIRDLSSVLQRSMMIP